MTRGKARYLVGKRILCAHETLTATNIGDVYCIDRIELDDGTQVRFLVHEMADDYAVELIVTPPEKEPK